MWLSALPQCCVLDSLKAGETQRKTITLGTITDEAMASNLV